MVQADVKTFRKGVYNGEVTSNHKPMTTRKEFFLHIKQKIVTSNTVLLGLGYTKPSYITIYAEKNQVINKVDLFAHQIVSFVGSGPSIIIGINAFIL